MDTDQIEKVSARQSWQEMALVRKDRRAENRERGTSALRAAGIAFEVLDSGWHLRIEHKGEVIDFTPGSNTWGHKRAMQWRGWPAPWSAHPDPVSGYWRTSSEKGSVMSDNIIPMRDTPHFALESEVADRVKNLLMEYEGRLSLVAAIGVLEVVKHGLMQSH